MNTMRAVLAGLILAALAAEAWAQPGPGDVYREVLWLGPYVNEGQWQRVTDPNTEHPDARGVLPNPVNTFELPSLDGATRAEIMLEAWGGHYGTMGKALRVNGGDWLDVPTPEAIPGNRGRGGEACEYLTFTYPVIELPLEALREGENTLEFTSGPQYNGGFGWGLWGVYGAAIRIYYDPGTVAHPAGRITAPAEGDALGLTVELAAEVEPGDAPIRSVDFIGQYRDFNYEGDGVWRQWHYTYRHGQMRHHLGSAEAEPWSARWQTDWVPDQDEPMRIMARIVDESGMCAMTESVDGLTLDRPGLSVRMYEPFGVPKGWVTRAHSRHRCQVMVRDDLSRVRAARAMLVTWSGAHANEIGLNHEPLVARIGLAHEYSCDAIDVPPEMLKPGVNTLHTFSRTSHHGIEVQWPGIVLLVQYNTSED